MVFGVFDGVHEGHRAFFREAKTHGDYLIAVLTKDEIVEKLKKHKPKFSFARRTEELEKMDGVDEVVASDAELGTYGVVLQHKPDIIAFGYDQAEFKKDLEKNYEKFSWKPKIVVLSAHEPEKYKSSLLNKR